jgi:hypothetical protein
MPGRDRRRLGLAILVILAGVALAGQVIVGRDLVGPAGLLLLFAPAVALVAMLGGSARAWPGRLLAALALTVAWAVLAGIAAALSPRGLDARSVAAAELGVLVAAVIAGLVRGARRPRRRLEPSEPSAARPPRRVSAVAVGSVGLIALGLGLAAAGYAIASEAAQTQGDAGFVQFWSTLGTTARAAQVGIANQSPQTLACSVTVTRQGRGTASVAISPLAPGQSWLSGLPTADATETAPWQLDLSCSAGTDQVRRHLIINPPLPVSG